MIHCSRCRLQSKTKNTQRSTQLFVPRAKPTASANRAVTRLSKAHTKEKSKSTIKDRSFGFRFDQEKKIAVYVSLNLCQQTNQSWAMIRQSWSFQRAAFKGLSN